MTSPVKKLGIWMDHSVANLMEFTTDPIVTKTIYSDTSQQGKDSDISKNENLAHNKEQHRQAEYYKKIEEEIKHYAEIILFGPTSAKAELFNLISENHHFSKIKIEVKQTDKMTKNQQHAFVKKHFTQH
jgi:hypothetical protein